MRVPVKENRICLSSGLKVIDSEAPESFLSEPDPTCSREATTVESPPILNSP